MVTNCRSAVNTPATGPRHRPRSRRPTPGTDASPGASPRRAAAISVDILGFPPDAAHARQHREEEAALPGRAADADVAALSFHEALGQHESEPRSLVALGRTGVDLFERKEESPEVLGADADARVLDLEAHRVRAVGDGAGAHPSLVRRELDGVGDVAVEHLPELGAVEHQRAECRVDERAEVDPLAGGQAADHLADLAQDL